MSAKCRNANINKTPAVSEEKDHAAIEKQTLDLMNGVRYEEMCMRTLTYTQNHDFFMLF